MICAAIDSKHSKANAMRNLCSLRQDIHFFPSYTKAVPTGATMVIVYGTLRGMSEIIQDAKTKRIPWMYVDNGYLGKNNRVIVNATAPITMRNGKRFDYDYTEKTWRGGKGDYILVCPPSYPYMDTFKLHGWLNDAVNTINCFTGRDIVVRAKPAKPIRADKARDLDEVLDNAYAVYTWGSAVALKAMQKGIPTISTGWCPAKAASFSLEDLETDKLLQEPNRKAIYDNLTWSSFDKDEMPNAINMALENAECNPL